MMLVRKEPWIGEIPPEWKLTAIKRLVSTKVTDGPHETPELEDDGVQFISAEAIKNDQIVFNLRRGFISQELHEQYSRKCKPRRGDIFVIKSGATTGNSACVEVDFEFSIWSPLALIRCQERIAFYKYVHYVLLSDVFRKQVELSWSFGTQQNIGMGVIEMLKVPLPPQPEQQRIAAYLDASCAAIDAAVAAKRHQLETLDSLRKSIIAHAVTKGLNRRAEQRESGVEWFGQIPKHWRCEHLKRFTTRIQAGMTPPTNTPEYYEDGTVPWFAPGSFAGDIDLREPRKLINELARRDGELRIFPAGTVFLVGIGATIGKIGLVSVEASCNQQLVGIVCGHRMYSRYLAYQFKIYEDVIPGIATATTLPIFDQVKTGYLRTLQPPREEQKAICEFLDTKLAESKQIVAAIETQIATLTAYRKSLIHECVTGQRRITERDLNHVKAHG